MCHGLKPVFPAWQVEAAMEIERTAGSADKLPRDGRPDVGMADVGVPDPGAPLGCHGARELPPVRVEAYNAELRDRRGFVGDRASNRAFRTILDEWRERLRELGDDPLGETPSRDLSKRKLDKLLEEGDEKVRGVILGVIEEFSAELARVARRLLRLKAWRGIERLVVGGGLSGSRIGRLAIARAGIALKTGGLAIDFVPIAHHPDEAGLLGAVHLAPRWIFSGYDAILAVDIGGSNIRAGLVVLNARKAPDLADAAVETFELWRHCDEKPDREAAVERLAGMLDRLVGRAAKQGRRLAPFVGVGCPGLIGRTGTIGRGGQNLPGNWESSRFNLAERLGVLLPKVDDHPIAILLHNDAVVQGLSQLHTMRDVRRWGVLTIGTGLGNASFTNRRPD